MRRSGLRINIFDPEEIYKEIGQAEIFQDDETMCLHLYNLNGKHTGSIDISDVLRLMINLT